MNVALRLILVVLGSLAAACVTDHVLFTYLSLNVWPMTYRGQPREDDIDWWKSHIGALPPAGDTLTNPPPMAMSGAQAPYWMWRLGLRRNAGAGTRGVDGAPNEDLPSGLMAYDVNPGTWLWRATVLSAPDRYVYRAAVAFPCVAVDRSWVGPHSVAVPHPTVGGWTSELKPLGMIVNAIPIAVVIALILWASGGGVRRVRARWRTNRGRCGSCSYLLLTEQDRCPECGARRRLIVKPAAET